MKKITIIIAAILLIMFFIMGCDKDKYHRDRYVGDWDFVTRSEWYQTDSISGKYVLIGCDTIYYLGTITYGDTENSLIIQYTENDKAKILINKHGKLFTLCPGAYCECGEFEGEDKVHFKLGWITPQNPEYINGVKLERRQK